MRLLIGHFVIDDFMKLNFLKILMQYFEIAFFYG